MTRFSIGIAAIIAAGIAFPGTTSYGDGGNSLDEQVQAFLDSRSGEWHTLNVNAADGKVLHDIILEHGYTRALEIGTSTGHSAIWIAWALSKTGGRLTTIEIDEGRHRTALQNFEEAGLAKYIDARLGDAHQIVPSLEGPFDFVFSDADKDWYARYLEMLLPKLEAGGCFTAHNVLNRMHGIEEFLTALEHTPQLETTIDTTSGSGISISYKKTE